jgi:hypothetical protein
LFLPLLFYVEVQVCEFILAFIILIENFKEGTINKDREITKDVHSLINQKY